MSQPQGCSCKMDGTVTLTDTQACACGSKMVIYMSVLKEHFLRAKGLLNAFFNPWWFTGIKYSVFLVKTAVCWDWYTTTPDLARFFWLSAALCIHPSPGEAFLPLQSWTGKIAIAYPWYGWSALAVHIDRIRCCFPHVGGLLYGY